MKLYYATGACSLAPHIVLHEGGFDFELEKVDLATKQTGKGESFENINPKGYVPALRLDNGEILTEAAIIIQYLADQKPESKLAPPMGTMERYRLMEWLHFISTELHKQYGPLFNPKITPEWRDNQLELINKRLAFLSEKLNGKSYLAGDSFSVADAYLFTVLSWSRMLKVDLSQFTVVQDYFASISERPKVRDTMKAEGLIK